MYKTSLKFINFNIKPKMSFFLKTLINETLKSLKPAIIVHNLKNKAKSNDKIKN